MQIRPFAIERYYERWEFRAELMLSSSDCESRTLADLLALEPGRARAAARACASATPRCPGSQELRDGVAAGYERTGADDVLALAAAEEGIFIAYHALLRPGDHAIVETPCYGSAPRGRAQHGRRCHVWRRRSRGRLGARPRRARPACCGPRRALIYINAPHNPTGTQMARKTFDAA